jgi:hypothetical protein
VTPACWPDFEAKAVLFSRRAVWDHPGMGENTEPRMAMPSGPERLKGTHHRDVDGYGNPITQQLRIIGQRRREAEEKLDRHLQDARKSH